MLRIFIIVIVAPAVALLGWLALAAPARRADFVVAEEEPRTIDPQRVSLLGEIQIARASFEGLTRENEKTLLPEPAVAERWDFDAESLTYTFHLRADARWSNGAPVEADHFRYAWLRALEPRLTAQYCGLLYAIRGAERYYTSRTNNDASDDAPPESVGVTAVDMRTLRVVLAQPCPFFLDLTCFATFFPVYPPAIERWRGPDGNIPARDAAAWTRPGNIVCNGAFVPTEWTFKEHIWLSRNPYYWDQQSIGVNSIEFYMSPDPNQALLAYETGRVHTLRSLTNVTARALRAESLAGRRPDFHLGPRFATYFFRVNCTRPPLDNPELRKALSLALDRESLANVVMGMGETPAYTYVPRGSIPAMPRHARDGRTIFYVPPDGLGADLSNAEREAAAREHLRRSGYDPANARPIEITYAPTPDYQRVSESVQSMWERVLGIRVSLRALEAKVLSSEVRNLNYDLVRADWYGDYMDPSTFLDMYTTGNGQNRTGWSNADYDRLMAAATVEPDDERRLALFRDAEKILCEDEIPIIPLFYRTGAFLLNPEFEGLRDNVTETMLMHRVRRVAR